MPCASLSCYFLFIAYFMSSDWYNNPVPFLSLRLSSWSSTCQKPAASSSMCLTINLTSWHWGYIYIYVCVYSIHMYDVIYIYMNMYILNDLLYYTIAPWCISAHTKAPIPSHVVPVPTPAATSPPSSPVAVNLGSATNCDKTYKKWTNEKL